MFGFALISTNLINTLIIIAEILSLGIFIFSGLYKVAIIEFILCIVVNLVYSGAKNLTGSIFGYLFNINNAITDNRRNKCLFCSFLILSVTNVLMLFYLREVYLCLLGNGYEHAPYATCMALFACTVPRNNTSSVEIYDAVSAIALAIGVITGSAYLLLTHHTIQGIMIIFYLMLMDTVIIGFLCNSYITYKLLPKTGNAKYKTSETIYVILCVILILLIITRL